MSEALESLPKGKLVSKLRGRIRLSERAEAFNARLTNTILSGAGGAAAGVLEARIPSIKGHEIASGGVIGAVVAIGLGFATKGRNSELMLELGQGMLAGAAAVKAHKMYLAKAGK